jgi:hypothetical protein
VESLPCSHIYENGMEDDFLPAPLSLPKRYFPHQMSATRPPPPKPNAHNPCSSTTLCPLPVSPTFPKIPHSLAMFLRLSQPSKTVALKSQITHGGRSCPLELSSRHLYVWRTGNPRGHKRWLSVCLARQCKLMLKKRHGKRACPCLLFWLRERV